MEALFLSFSFIFRKEFRNCNTGILNPVTGMGGDLRKYDCHLGFKK